MDVILKMGMVAGQEVSELVVVVIVVVGDEEWNWKFMKLSHARRLRRSLKKTSLPRIRSRSRADRDSTRCHVLRGAGTRSERKMTE
jgi:hypothetical protein